MVWGGLGWFGGRKGNEESIGGKTQTKIIVCHKNGIGLPLTSLLRLPRSQLSLEFLSIC